MDVQNFLSSILIDLFILHVNDIIRDIYEAADQ